MNDAIQPCSICGNCTDDGTVPGLNGGMILRFCRECEEWMRWEASSGSAPKRRG